MLYSADSDTRISFRDANDFTNFRVTMFFKVKEDDCLFNIRQMIDCLEEFIFQIGFSIGLTFGDIVFNS